MKTTIAVILAAFVPLAAAADDHYKVATVISAAELDGVAAAAPADRVSDQPVVHVESAEGRLGIGVVHRPAIQPGGPIRAIQHHNQSEVYRVMWGKGTLVTGTTMNESTALDADGFVVTNLTGPSDTGVIDEIHLPHASFPKEAGDFVMPEAGTGGDRHQS